ncbi:zinc-ribbon domain-containing protein [Secundilactobacillus hailunensis]|uniref:Zinc-ribbon domain-containing protein n=1 Tax=Secundilactobacillus hailunensis TaxID=2559923 RepID=A0ABW1T748_9LACO|nr:zinc ribbon domain-containing protein [Secundilactobacillus hailunensis]
MPEELKYCPNCGAEVSATDEFCGKCGFDLKTFRAEQAKSAASGAKPTVTAHTTGSQSQPRTAQEKRVAGRKPRKRWP